MEDFNRERPVLIFDGECNLCNRSVQFVIRHDRKERFLFAQLQSEFAQKIVNNLPGLYQLPDSFIILYNGKCYFKTDAVILSGRLLGGFFRLLAILRLIPRFLRDSVYDRIAANRYRWFGKRDRCMIPGPELMKRFLSR